MIQDLQDKKEMNRIENAKNIFFNIPALDLVHLLEFILYILSNSLSGHNIEVSMYLNNSYYGI